MTDPAPRTLDEIEQEIPSHAPAAPDDQAKITATVAYLDGQIAECRRLEDAYIDHDQPGVADWYVFEIARLEGLKTLVLKRGSALLKP